MRQRTWLLGGAIAALLVGPALAETPKDTVVMAKQIDDIISLDPGEAFEFSGTEVVGNVYDKLLGFDLKNVSDIQGRLAESWNVGDDGRTYTFKLRKGLKFASGDPITAADAAYSLQRAVSINKTPGFILTQFGFTKDNIKERIRATDPETLVLVTEKAFAPSFLYYCLTANVASVVDSKIVQQHAKADDFGNDWLKTNSAGSGPFRLRAWHANENYTLEANDNYWGKKPSIKRVVVRHVSEPATQRLLLEAGDVDYARNLAKDQLDALAGNAAIATQSALKGGILYIGLNQKNPFLAKPEVREALKYLVDYDAIQKNIVSTTFAPHQSFLPAGFLGAIEDRPYKLDVPRAKELLAKAGLANGFTVTLDAQGAAPISDIAQAIQATFAQAGVKLEIIPADRKQVFTKYRARNHDMAMVEWGPDYQDPHTNAQTFAMNPDNSDDAAIKTSAWRNAWDIPDMTRRTEAALLETDVKKREAMYQELQREHQKISPFIFLFQEVDVVAHRKNVDGFIQGPDNSTNQYATIVKD